MYYNIIITIIITSAVPIAWPLVLMCAAFSRTANQNNFMLNTSLGSMQTPDKCQVEWTVVEKLKDLRTLH